MALLDRNGVNIYYEVHGEGPTLILTHGFSATSAMWKPQLSALGEHYQVVVWDMRGHGQSDSPADDSAYSEAHTTADIAALLDAVGAQSAIVGGLSLGGYMSLAFYADYPERVDSLLIIDTGPGFKKDAARTAWNVTANTSGDNIEKLGEVALSAGSAERAAAVHKDLAGVVRAARNMLTQHNDRVIQSLPDIKVPALVVVGADDEPFLAATDYMAAKIPLSRKVIIDNAGHASNIDQPETFNRAVLGFLADLPRSA
ncbi:MAG: alpha/beta fold hydrolase [Pseudomonadaceae bacterium]|nr:alpha/beta fold hydrolase [Pseudomonadaceae bacterium]